MLTNKRSIYTVPWDYYLVLLNDWGIFDREGHKYLRCVRCKGVARIHRLGGDLNGCKRRASVRRDGRLEAEHGERTGTDRKGAQESQIQVSTQSFVWNRTLSLPIDHRCRSVIKFARLKSYLRSVEHIEI